MSCRRSNSTYSPPIPLPKALSHPSLSSRTNGNPAWALVTDASSGIGKQLRHELATHGFNVVLHGRSIAKLQSAQKELEQAHPGRDFRILVADAAQCLAPESKGWTASLEALNLNVLVNNAGRSTEQTLGTLDSLSSDRLITDASVNALFPAPLLRDMIPLLHRNAPALIFNIGSLGDLAPAQVGSYGASKANLMKLTEMLSREMCLTGHDVEILGIRVRNVYGTLQTAA